jgi:transketolase
LRPAKRRRTCSTRSWPALTELIGGSADLTGSNLTMAKASKAVGKEGGGNYVFYGVREFGMCAVMNGLALHGGLIPYGGTFLVFPTTPRNALRLAGADGPPHHLRVHPRLDRPGRGRPTHQPIEHAATLRLIPTWTSGALRHGRDRGGLGGGAASAQTARARCCFRQNVPFCKRNPRGRSGAAMSCATRRPRRVIIATGSEVQLALGRRSSSRGGRRRAGGFHALDQRFRPPGRDYRNSVLPGLPKVAVEAGVSDIGASTSASRARWSASTATANPPRAGDLLNISALPPKTS